MSARPSATGIGARITLARLKVDDLADVMAIENDMYPHPWTHGNFLDSLYSGYEMWTVREALSNASTALAGYFLLMPSVDEGHLLNITVRRDLQGHGLGRLMLDHAVALARGHDMKSMLLEVRPSNERAIMVYERYGFSAIGLRKGYYPAADGHREDAIVMSLAI